MAAPKKNPMLMSVANPEAKVLAAKEVEPGQRGVQLAVLKKLAKDFEESKEDYGTPTCQNLVKFIQQQTKGKKCSYAEFLLKTAPGKKKALDVGIGPCNVYVSFAREYTVAELVSAVESFEAEQLARGLPLAFFYYVELTAADYNGKMPTLEQIKNVIKGCTSTILVISPWDFPSPLKNLRCLYETGITIKEKKPLAIVAPPAQLKRFEMALSGNGKGTAETVNKLCTPQKPSAEGDDDEKELTTAMTSPPFKTIAGVQRKIGSVIKEWAVVTAPTAMKKRQLALKSSGKKGEEMQIERLTLASDVLQCGQFLLVESKPKEALHCFGQSANTFRAFKGPTDIGTFTAEKGLAEAYLRLGDLPKAGALLDNIVKSLSGMGQGSGGSGSELFEESQLLLVAVKMGTKKLEEAYRLLNAVYEARKKRVENPEDPPDSFLKVQMQLAKLKMQMGKADEGAEMFDSYIKCIRKTRGDDHPATYNATLSFGNLLMKAKMFKDAEVQIRSSLEVRLKVQGKLHPEVLTTQRLLATLLLQEGKLDEAKKLFEANLAACKEAGEKNMKKAASQEPLAEKGLAAAVAALKGKK